MSLRELFWAGQKIYLTEVFLPVIIGVLVFAPLLAVLFCLWFWASLSVVEIGAGG